MRKKTFSFLLIILSLFMVSSCVNKKPKTETENVELLFSGSSFSSNGFKEKINTYEEYLLYEYNLELDETFFETYFLYTFGFLNSNIGSLLYKLYSYEIQNNVLNITLKENIILSSPAFGGYSLVFAIKKSYFELVEDINITGIYGTEEKLRYYLFINDENRYITNELDFFYYEGDKVLIQTKTIKDANLELYINDVFHSIQTEVKKSQETIWEFYFIMPKEDVVISFKQR